MTTFTDITCPFCGLLCDDLTVKPGQDGMHVAGGCPRAETGFGRPASSSATASISGHAVAPEQALARAASLLREARQPFIGGLSTDVEGCRSALALAEHTGAVVDHMSGPALAAGGRVLQRRGWIMTTLTEVKNRADVVVLFGTDGDSVCPRFSERCLEPSVGMAAGGARERQVFYVGEPAGTKEIKKRLPNLSVIPCARRDLLRFTWNLGAEISAPGPKGARADSRVRSLANALRNAAYAVLVWAPIQLPDGVEDIIIEGLCDSVSRLNERTRAAGLTLGGSDGAITAMNVCAWQTGYPLRVSFATGAPMYDPVLNSMEAMLTPGNADVVLWISAITARPPPRGPWTVIALSAPSPQIARTADVYIPVATPGVESAGSMFRMDSVVSLPVRKLRNSPDPSVAEALDKIRRMI